MRAAHCFTVAAVLALGLMLVPAQASAEAIFAGFLGGNATWYDRDAAPVDVEASANARASLSPHISLVGSGAYGFRRQHYRYTAGLRITATDVQDKYFSIGLGFQYRGSGYEFLRPDEWAPDASVGWVPWPTQLPDVVLVGQGWYGIDSNVAGALAGVRYRLPF